ncbi:MAG: hypothetical protein ABIP97_10220 [Chthoniobacterales bacterium]
MNKIILLFLACVLFSSCAQQSPQSEQARATNYARQAISKREQWAYDGDYKVTPYIVDGKKAGWTVQVMRINDPRLPASNKSRYYGSTPVVVVLDQNGNVISYSSPFRKQ